MFLKLVKGYMQLNKLVFLIINMFYLGVLYENRMLYSFNNTI